MRAIFILVPLPPFVTLKESVKKALPEGFFFF